MAQIGTNTADNLTGSAAADTIFGLDGDDALAGSGGDDSINGGNGNDVLGLSDVSGPRALLRSFIENETGNDTIVGGPGNDTIVAGSGNDVIYGIEGDDLIFADGNGPGSTLAGDDFIAGGAGSDKIAGGAGFDVAYFDLPHRVYVVSSTSFGFPGKYPDLLGGPVAGITVTTGSGAAAMTDYLIEMEELRFVDGRMVTNPNDAVAQVYRVYEAGLDRAPDLIGLNYWAQQISAGLPLNAFANSVVQSPEFQVRYGGLDNAAFVQQLYQNMLGRAGDPGGVSFWTGSLNAGSTRGDVLLGFANGPENTANTAAVTTAGIWDQDERAAQVARLYDTAFNRPPDLGGFLANKAALDGGATQDQLVRSFEQSPEFATLYGGPGVAPQTLVNALYVNALNRPADAAGLDFWTRQIQNQAATREQVIINFSESLEHQISMLPSIEGGIVFA